MSFTVRSAHPLAHSLRSHARPHALRRARGLCGVAIAPYPHASSGRTRGRSHGLRHACSRSTSAFASTSLCPRSRWSHALRSLRSHARFARTLARSPETARGLCGVATLHIRTLALLVRSLTPTLPLVARALKWCRFRSR